MGLFRASAGLKGVKRFGGIARVLIKHGLGDVVERAFSRKDKEGEPGKSSSNSDKLRSVRSRRTGIERCTCASVQALRNRRSQPNNPASIRGLM